MQVFKAYFKVIRASAGLIFMYLAIFISIAVMISVMSPSSGSVEFSETKTRVAVINRDGDAALAKGLSDYIADIFTVVPYEDDPHKLQDGLFFRDIEYVVIIPQGFSAAFMAAGSDGRMGTNPSEGPGMVEDRDRVDVTSDSSGSSEDSGRVDVIQKVIVPGSTSSHYVDIRIDKFLHTASIYRDFGAVDRSEAVIGDFGTADHAAGVGGGFSVDADAASAYRALDVHDGKEASQDLQSWIVAAVRADLAQDTLVSLLGASEDVDELLESRRGYAEYFGVSSYALLAMIIMGISSIMIAFNRTDLRLRNQCAPIPQRRFDLAIAAGHAIFSLGCWAAVVLSGIILYGFGPLRSGWAWLHLVNLLTYTIVCAGIGFAVGHFVRTSSGQSGAVNVISLGMSFLCGVFVPQSVMSESVLAVGRFLPAYWYIRANNAIAALSTSQSVNLRPIYGSMLIQLGFAAAIFSGALLFSKERSRAEL